MTQKILPWLCVGVLAIVCCVLGYKSAQPGFQPTLQLVGDIEQCREFTQTAGLGTIERVMFDNETFQAVSLAQVVEDAHPTGNVERVLMIANDGFTAEVSGDSITNVYLTVTAKDGWRAVSPSHPISANPRQLRRVVVVTDVEAADSAIQIVKPSGTTWITCGALYAGETMEYPYVEGMAEIETAGKIYTSTVYTRRDCISIPQLGGENGRRMLLTTVDGTQTVPGADGLFQLVGNRLDYLDITQRTVIQDILSVQFE